VKKVAQEVYDRIDNDLYHEEGDIWWQSDSPLYLITAVRLEVEENQLVSVFGEIGILFDGLKGA
jgi:hypothetical protein